MSIYLKIGESNFKLPKRIIIGRGAPFSIFDEDQNVSRTHFLLLRKKDGVYVKDLGSRSGTYLNDHKLTPNKLVKWNEGQELRLGDFPVQLHSSAPESECVEVTSLGPDTYGDPNTVIKWLFSFFTAYYAFYLCTGDLEWGLVEKLLSLMLVSFIFFILYWCYKLFFYLIFPKNMFVKEFYFSDEGFAAHYDAGDSINFKMTDIIEWSTYLGGAMIRMKNGEVYNFNQLKKKKVLLTFLQTHLSSCEAETKWYKSSKMLLLLMPALWFVLDYFYDTFGSSSLGVIALITVGASFFLKKTAWTVDNRFINTKKMRMALVPLFFLSIVFLMYSPSDQELALENQDRCKSGKNLSCEMIDYKALTKNEIHGPTLVKACESKNKSACALLKTDRLPASEK